MRSEVQSLHVLTCHVSFGAGTCHKLLYKTQFIDYNVGVFY